MKEKGFTLVEMLAILVLLAVISLIAIPNVTNTIENSKKNSFLNSVDGLIETIEQEYTQIQEQQLITEVIEFNLTTGQNMERIDVKGIKPTDGYVRMNPSGLTEVFVKNERYCAKKTYDQKRAKVFLLKDDECKEEAEG